MFTHEILSELSELELSIYNCILRHRENIGRMKIKELADEAHVSTATVLRFCRKMGCEGYAEFKLRYKEHLEKKSYWEIPARPRSGGFCCVWVPEIFGKALRRR